MIDLQARQSALNNRSIEVGRAAPDFCLSGENGSDWRLSDQMGNVSVLLFYPQNETLVCTRQMCSLRDNWREYESTKAAIVGISSGTSEQHRTFAGKYRLPISLLVDVERKITKLYSEHWLLPVALTRAVVVIDAKGVIRYRKIMLRAFRPDDHTILREIYAARTNAIYETFDRLNQQFLSRKKDDL